MGLTSCALLRGDCVWPSAQRVFVGERHVLVKKTGKEGHAQVYRVVSRILDRI